MNYIPIDRRDRIRLRMAYRRLHVAAGNCLPPGWQYETNMTGQPAVGGCCLDANPQIASMVARYKATAGEHECIDNADVVTSIAVWCWQLSNGASVSELRGRIAKTEDDDYAEECDAVLDQVVAMVGSTANLAILPFLNGLRGAHDNQE